MPPGSGGDLERLQLTIGFMAARFEALAGIAVIQVFAEVLSEAVPSVLPRDYLEGTVKTIVATYRIIMIPLEDLLSQWCAIRHPDLVVLP